MFKDILNKAIKSCNGDYIEDDFNLIYPFTTENINGYINLFNLKDKSLLTTGSSGDQIINSLLKQPKKITCVDTNPYTKYYYYLKVAGILTLSLDEFLLFFRYNDYPKVFKKNQFVFSEVIYQKIRNTLKKLDYESYLFWEVLFSKFDREVIRNNLFSLDEDRTYVIKTYNSYLCDDISFNRTKEKIKNFKPVFLNGDIFKTKLNDKYDNIFLSNIGTYYEVKEYKVLIDRLNSYLNYNGKLLICYLYDTILSTKYSNDWASIYDIKKTLSIFKEYYPKLLLFNGVKSIKYNTDNYKDSVLVYKKIRR